MKPIEVYIVAVVHVGLVVAIAYPSFYLRSPWRSTEVGRALMTKGVALATLFAVSVVGYWWPFPGYLYFYAAAVTGVVGAMAYQFAVMRRLQRRGRAPANGRF